MSENISEPESSDRLSARVAELEAKLAEALKTWRCFHCGFESADAAESAAHFGDRDDPDECKPLCRWWQSMTPEERGDALQDTIQQLNSERDDNHVQRTEIEGLQFRLLEFENLTCSRFKGCRSINDAFNLFDSTEGRALVADARAVAAEAALREARKFASDLANKYHFDYKRGDKRGDSYTEGKSDAADEIAQKLAALAPQAEPQAPEVVESATPSPLRAVYETPEFKAEWLPKCPVCFDETTYRTPNGKYWCSRAHSWNHVECGECQGGRVRVYPGTPIGHTEICRGCNGSGVADRPVAPAPEKCQKCGGSGWVKPTHSFSSERLDCPACLGGKK